MTTKTFNQTVDATTREEFERKLNEMNAYYGQKIFATQTHITWAGDHLVYTAVFFIREVTQ
jgi:hypothetical protein